MMQVSDQHSNVPGRTEMQLQRYMYAHHLGLSQIEAWLEALCRSYKWCFNLSSRHFSVDSFCLGCGKLESIKVISALDSLSIILRLPILFYMLVWLVLGIG
jgi:hypothetical protein